MSIECLEKLDKTVVRAVGVSTCGAVPTEETYLEYQRAGIDRIELSYAYPSDHFKNCDWAQHKAWADKYGIEIASIHLPFSMNANPAQLDDTIREAAYEEFCDIIEKSLVTNAKIYVIHASSEPIADADRPKAMENAKDSLRRLAEFAQERGVKIAVEDLPRTCLGRNSEEILELISAHENLYVCFDTNHLLKEDNIHFMKAVGKNIITTHFSDYDFVDERHWLPGEGDIDWVAFMDTLDEVGYCGTLMYELSRTAKNVIRENPLIGDDFVRNAKELTERKPLTVLGKRAI